MNLLVLGVAACGYLALRLLLFVVQRQISFDPGERLAGLFPRASFFPVVHGHHNDLWSRPEVLAWIGEFLR